MVPKLICVIANKYFILIKFTIARKLIFMCYFTFKFYCKTKSTNLILVIVYRNIFLQFFRIKTSLINFSAVSPLKFRASLTV